VGPGLQFFRLMYRLVYSVAFSSRIQIVNTITGEPILTNPETVGMLFGPHSQT